MHDFLLAIIFEIDAHAPGRRFSDYSIERDYHDAGIGSLFDGAVQGIRRGRINDDRIVTLQNQVLNLRCLGWYLFVSRGENVRGAYYPVGYGFLGDNIITLQHGLPPRIARSEERRVGKE